MFLLLYSPLSFEWSLILLKYIYLKESIICRKWSQSKSVPSAWWTGLAGFSFVVCKGAQLCWVYQLCVRHAYVTLWSFKLIVWAGIQILSFWVLYNANNTFKTMTLIHIAVDGCSKLRFFSFIMRLYISLNSVNIVFNWYKMQYSLWWQHLILTLSLQRSPNRKMYTKAFEDQSDNDSETSSVCSERSFDSCRRNDVSKPLSL